MSKIPVGTRIEAALWRRFTNACRSRGIAMARVLESLIENWLKEKTQ